MWDFCCDHGKLGQQALRSGQFPKVHFVDQAAHLIQALQEKWAYDSRAVFFAHSAEEIQENLTGTVVITGIGFHTMNDILKACMVRSKDVERWILGPHRHEENLLPALDELAEFKESFALVKMWTVIERGRERQFLAFDRVP